MQKNAIKVIIVILLLGILVFLLYKYESKSKHINVNAGEVDANNIKIETHQVANNIDNLIDVCDVINDDASAEIVIYPEQFSQRFKQTQIGKDGNFSVAMLPMLKTELTDTLMFQFSVFLEGEQESKDLLIQIDNYKISIPVSNRKEYVYIPVKNINSLDRIAFSQLPTESTTTIVDEMYLVNYHDEYALSELAKGVYNCDEHKQVSVCSENQIIRKGIQCIKKNDYYYSISYDEFIVSKLDSETNEVVEICSISNLGGTLRDMAIKNNMIYITAREYGLWVIDISSPEEPEVVSHYDTLDYATGIDISGDFCFVACRFSGVEVIDISNLSKPKFVCTIGHNREYQDVFVNDSYLYVGVYEEHAVDIWNISDLNNPILISKIALDGQGQGCFVKDGILYAATGLTNSLASNSSEICDFNKGAGSGLEIWDVKSPENPSRLSIYKINGSFWYNLVDIWDVVVSNEYAYLTDMYEGVHVINVKDPRNPICESIYTVTSGERIEKIDTDKYIISYNQNEDKRDCIFHTLVLDGEILLCTRYNGIFSVSDARACKINSKNYYNFAYSNSNYTVPELNKYDTQLISTDYCVLAVDVDEKYIYAAGGESGLHIYDKSMKELCHFDCKSSVRDIHVYGDYIITAEMLSGIGIYKYHNGEINTIGYYENKNKSYCFTQIGIGRELKFVLAKVSMDSYIILSTENFNDIHEVKFEGQDDLGLSYSRTITEDAIDSGWIGVQGLNEQHWYDYVDGKCVQMKRIETPRWKEVNGVSTAGNYGITMVDKGFYYYDATEDELQVGAKTIGVPVNGKSSSNEKLLVSTGYTDGNIAIVDISNIENPILMEQFVVTGNPDIAKIYENNIYIPCRNMGLLCLTQK